MARRPWPGSAPKTSRWTSTESRRTFPIFAARLVLNFWGTWCPPCVEETPELNRLQKYIESRNGVVLGVAADEDPAVYEKFLRDQGVDFPTYRDPNTKDNHSPIAESYGTSMIPETYIIDRQGKIARKIIGFQKWDSPQMRAYFDSLLGKS